MKKVVQITLLTAFLISCTPQTYYREGFFSNEELDDFLIADLPSIEQASTPFVHQYKALLSFYGTVEDVSVFDAYGEELFTYLVNSEALAFVGHYESEIDLSSASCVKQSSVLLDYRSDFPTYSFYYTDNPRQGNIIRGFNLTLSFQEQPHSVDVGEENPKSANLRMVLETERFMPIYENS